MLEFLTPTTVAVVVGASGGIGCALVDGLRTETAVGTVLATGCRRLPAEAPRVRALQVDVADETSIARAAEIARAHGEVRLVIVASGVLHESPTVVPEKSWGMLDGAMLARVFAVNAIGPALVAKHFLPLLPRDGRAVFAALSARVGSIEDNRLGGWYAYRASKAALNMLLRTLALELRRRAPEAICVGLHPGTVDTSLSAPYAGRIPPEKRLSPARSAAHLLRVIDDLEREDSGDVLAWNGARIPA